MPTREILRARLVPALPVSAANALPLSWGAQGYAGEEAPGIPGGLYTPGALAAAIDAMLAPLCAGAVRCFWRPVLDEADGRVLAHAIVLRNTGSETLTLHAASEEFALPVEGPVAFGVGAAHGSADITCAPGSDAMLLVWPLSGAHPLRLGEEPLRFEAARADAVAESGRRYSWAGRTLSRLSARLPLVPLQSLYRPAGWAVGEALWNGSGADAPLAAIFGPRSAVLRGAPFLLYPDERSRRFFFLRLDESETRLSAHLMGFADLSFTAFEQELPAAEGRRTGMQTSDDFSGDLSAWSNPGPWSLSGGELRVDTAAASSVLTLGTDFADAELEIAPRLPAAPGPGERCVAGLGLDLGAARRIGIGVEIRNEGGTERVRLVSWSENAAGGDQVIADLERAKPVGAPAPRLRVQLFSNPRTGAPRTRLWVRAWLGTEGPFETSLAPGFDLPDERSPIIFYEDDLAADPGEEAAFAGFSARELLHDAAPDRLRVEELGVS